MSHTRFRSIVLGVLLTLIGVSPALAEEWRWSFSSSVDYSRGDYGTGEKTTILYVPFTLGVTPIDPLTLSLTVPYIRQTSQTVLFTGGGVAVDKEKKAQLATARRGVTKTEDGLGDILLKGEYVLLQEQPFIPEITPSLTIKFPTADEDRGLGTGEFDETIAVDFSKTVAEPLVVHLMLGYTFVGSPPGRALDNSFSWSIGTDYSVAKPFTVSLFLSGATAISPEQDDPLELSVGAEYKLTKAVSFNGSVGVGLTDGSPDFSFSGGIGFRF